jgi:Zn-dependent peptidase ImmA (M78 family)/transcriptional regulator with XRE-family HTH domain
MNSEFLGQNLRLARLFHGLSLQELGDRVDRSKQFLSRVESGFEDPTPALESSLAEVLEVLPEFFRAVDPMPITEEQCHFRKQLTTKVALRQSARARGEMFKRLVAILDKNLELPKYHFVEGDPSTPEQIERAAESSRITWGLGLGPISNMTRVAENAGAVVMKMHGIANEIDAISFATKRPVITLNAEGKSACRARFGIAHEIGHLSVHVGIQTGDKLTESQANRFASAFLMPRSYFVKECERALRGNRLGWRVLAEIKRRWGVSKAAILYRGRQLGIFSDDQYRSGVIHLHRHGEAIREAEDDEFTSEQPEVVPEALKVLEKQCGMPRAVVAREMFVQPRILSLLLNSPIPNNNNVVNLFERRS